MIDYTKITKCPNSEPEYHPFYYDGFRAEQSKNIFPALDKLAENCRPKQIIEIGIRKWGFTKILDDHPISDEAEIYGVDIFPDLKGGLSSKVLVFQGDCFSLKGLIKRLIRSEGTTLVFCDGGNKNREVSEFAEFLKPGDIIFGHDYAPNEEIWRKEYLGKVWDWLECWDSGVEESVRKFNLKPYLKEYFDKAVWNSLIK